MKREDDYQARREQLKGLSDEALQARFWELTERLTSPLTQLARENTSPAIERSVLLRMGFSSVESKAIVEGCQERSLLCHGAGNVVYRYAREKNLPLREAGLRLMDKAAMDEAAALFGGKA